MQKKTRTQNTIQNTIYGIATQILTVLISFITRTFFIKYLSVEYLGVNGLFTNILTVLSLAELGFGGAIVYSMYRPLAMNDSLTLKGLMRFYSKVYRVIGISVGGIGLLLVPFLSFLVKDAPNVSNLTIIYLMFLLNSVVSYFFSYKRSILQADQKQYIISKISLYATIVKSSVQIIILVTLKNYLLFLTIQIVFTVLENYYISKKVNEIYDFLDEKNKIELDSKEKTNIWLNVKALMIYKVGSTALDGTDNIIISSVIGVSAVGYLSNYLLIIGSISMVLQQLTNAITGSIGNYVATEKLERQEALLGSISFLYFMIFGFSFVSLSLLLNPFITLWLGREFTLSGCLVFILSFNWYITGMMNPVWTFRSTKGLFVYGKYRPVVSAIINILVSIILAAKIGLLGVLLGTTITRLTTNSWYDPYIVFKYGFKKSPKKYLCKQLLYFFTLGVPLFILMYLFTFFTELNYVTFFIQIILVVVVTIGTLILMYGRTKDFKYLLNVMFFRRKSK